MDGEPVIDNRPRPEHTRLTLLAAGLLGVEAAGLLIGAVLFVIETFRSTPASVAGAIFLAVLIAVLGAVLAAAAVGALRHGSWIRGPVVTWQLVQAGVAMRLAALVSWWLGLPLLVIAIVIGVLIAGPWVVDPRAPASD